MQVVERLIGKPEQIAAIVGYKEKAAFPWRNSTKNRPAGHFPSTLIIQRLLAHAATHQIPLTADHLIWGAPEAEIAELEARNPLRPPAFISRRTPHQEAAE